MSGPNSHTRHHLLSTLSRSDFALLRDKLSATELGVRKTMEAPNRPIEDIYFPDSGIISVVAEGAHGRQSEVGLIGSEGMTGSPILLGDDRTPHLVYVQVAGRGQKMKAGALRQAMQEGPTIRNCFLHFVQAFMVQATHTAVANGRGKLHERLARWLLMAQDRVGGPDIPLTHEFLALMLNVRRAGVTEALASLTRKNLISAKRGIVTIKDRECRNVRTGCTGSLKLSTSV